MYYSTAPLLNVKHLFIYISLQAGSASGAAHRDTRRTSTGGPSKVGAGSTSTGMLY